VPEFTHGPHCIPGEDYANLMRSLNRLLASNRMLAAQLREEQAENAALRERIAELLGIEGRKV
jgi:hypothetical protein